MKYAFNHSANGTALRVATSVCLFQFYFLNSRGSHVLITLRQRNHYFSRLTDK